MIFFYLRIKSLRYSFYFSFFFSVFEIIDYVISNTVSSLYRYLIRVKQDNLSDPFSIYQCFDDYSLK